VREGEERLAAGPLAAAAGVGAAHEVEHGQEGDRVLVVGLEEEAFVAPAGAIVVGRLFRVELFEDRGCRLRQRQVVLRRDDEFRCQLVREWLPELERDDLEVVASGEPGQTCA
jgi:hypothetical protein